MGVEVSNGVTIQDHLCQLTTKAGEQLECAHMRIFIKGSNALAVVSQMPGMWKKNFIARTPRAISLYEQALARAGVEDGNFTYIEHLHPEVANLDGREYYAIVKPFRTEQGGLTIREETKDRQSISKLQVQALLNERVLAVSVPELDSFEPKEKGEEEPPFWLSHLGEEEDLGAEPRNQVGTDDPSLIIEGETNAGTEKVRDPNVIYDPDLDTAPLSPEEEELLRLWEGEEVAAGFEPVVAQAREL